ncbi:nascent polypeptide-associated complex protein [Candidatus Woesearchaeota archaeon]|nr:MAG: nascent polypeptide-associated complex protein [Candidatus Woesearchaeota archaeon]
MNGINPRQMQQMMKRMGIQQAEIDDALQVIIKCKTREIIIDNPQVSKVNMMGQQTYQVIGNDHERSLDTMPEISEEDIEMVMEQTTCTKEEAKKAIENAKGDLAEAILSLS